MNINNVVILINFLFTKLWKLFRKTKDFLFQAYLSLALFGTTLWNFLSSMLYNFVLVWLYNYFDMSVTDESYVDETRVWRTKL